MIQIKEILIQIILCQIYIKQLLIILKVNQTIRFIVI